MGDFSLSKCIGVLGPSLWLLFQRWDRRWFKCFVLEGRMASWTNGMVWWGAGVLCNSLAVQSQKKVTCVFSRQSWFSLFAKGGRLAESFPTAWINVLWWLVVLIIRNHLTRQGLNSSLSWSMVNLEPLEYMCIWWCLARALLIARDELKLWGLAGARVVSFLTALASRGLRWLRLRLFLLS